MIDSLGHSSFFCSFFPGNLKNSDSHCSAFESLRSKGHSFKEFPVVI